MGAKQGQALGKSCLPVESVARPRLGLAPWPVDPAFAFAFGSVAAIEGNAGKPIYHMSKWWARRRSSVFRSMLLAAAMKAPDDESKAAKAVWDVRAGGTEIPYAPRKESGPLETSDAPRRKSEKSYALRSQSEKRAEIPHAVRAELNIRHTVSGESWQPGWLHSNLSWTHYRTLLRVEKPEARAFYEIEALQSNWSARELERQINSLLYERLALTPS